MPYEKKGNNRSRRRASGFVMVVAKNCTLKPSSKDAWGVDLTPLFLVGLLGEAADAVEIERLETLAFT